MEQTLLYLSLKYQGDFNKILKAIKVHEEVDFYLLEEFLKTMDCQYTTLLSDDYPKRLKEIALPPFVLYYYGNLDLVKNKTIGIVGMRQMSDYGKQATDYFAKNLAINDYTIVSGMAKGVDAIAHLAAINNNGSTIAVLGTGIDYVYPKENRLLYDELKKNQLIISEYPHLTTPSKRQFPYRNRIIAGLSDSILISEARVKSGTMITAGYALEQGKTIYCIPSRYNDYNGCNELIRQGATLVLNASDIMEDEDFH
ncbi:MAG: DNA-processing protein DprA [Erysipelotrichaceae bacterium]|nr:DNA-processing protein DprA [Erysipelotrichaceae bacterium]